MGYPNNLYIDKMNGCDKRMGIVLLSFQSNSPVLSVHAEHVEPNTQRPLQQIESLTQALQYSLRSSGCEVQMYPVSVHL